MMASARNALIAVVVAAVLATGTIWFLTRDRGDAGTEVRPGQTAASPTASTEPEITSFRFEVADREVMSTVSGRLSKRERRTAREASGRVQSILKELYVGAFLDPENWTTGTYDDLFEIFAGNAREEARRREGILTAGEDAGDRFDRIEPVDGRSAMQILLDRGGKPIVVASTVRFQARGSGAEPTLIRSEGTYLFRRTKAVWRIVSFDVERADREEGAT
jgi:hypothetical protein